MSLIGTNGKFISGDPFVYTSWAKSIDTITGQPIETDFAHYQNTNTDISPTYDGAHNWRPMAYNPKTNLVYIPAAERVAPYGHDPHWEYGKSGFGSGNGWNLGTGTDPSKPNKKILLLHDWLQRNVDRLGSDCQKRKVARLPYCRLEWAC